MESELIRFNMLGCLYCPIGKDKIDRRYERLKEYDDWQPDYCCCDKINEEHFWIGGLCEDAHIGVFITSKKSNKSKYKNHNKYLRNKFHKQKLLENIVVCSDIDYAYDSLNYFNSIHKSDNGVYYVQPLHLSGKRKVCKKLTNKRVRKTEVFNYSNYRKQSEYWHILF